ncbi:hypothetical protein D3C76_1431150 [compost metagenome]
MGLAAEDRRDVGEDGKHCTRTDDGQGQRPQHRATAQYPNFGQYADAFRRRQVRQGEPQRGHGHHAEAGDTPECGAPAEQFAKPGGQRHTADGCQGKAHEHRRNRPGSFLRSDDAGGDDGANAKERPVVQ